MTDDQNAATIETVLDDLDERDRLVLCKWYGLRGEQQETLDAIGQALGVSRQRAWQIKERALIHALDFLAVL